MPYSPVDPASLEGDDLLRWYRRSPWDIEQERQAARRQQYIDFFGVDPGGSEDGEASDDGDSGDGNSEDASAVADDQEFPPQDTFSKPSYDPTGYVPGLLGALRGLSPPTQLDRVSSANGQVGGDVDDDNQSPSPGEADQSPNPIFDTGLATTGDATWIPLGGKTPKQRRLWSQHTGQDWPTVPETGENFHLHHYIPKGDGGTEELDNFGPMDPSAHRQHHMENGDFSRWAKRRWAGKPMPPEVEGLGVWQLIPDITGIMSGRIRTDSVDNFWSDMLGIPSQEDIRQYHERLRQKVAPSSPPGTSFEGA